MKEEIQVRISEEELVAKIKEIAQQINEDYAGKKVHLVCILSGSVFLPVNWQNILQCRLPWIL